MSTSGSLSEIPVPPNGGYGYVISVAAFFLYALSEGCYGTYGIFFKDIANYYGTNSATTAIAGSVAVGASFGLSAATMMPLLQHYTCRRLTIIVSILCSASLILSTFCPNIISFIFVYGVVHGTLIGTISYPCVISIGYYFTTRRVLSYTIMIAGGSAGTLTLAPLFGYLLEIMDWKNAFVVSAGILLNGAVAGSLLRPLEAKPRRRSRPTSVNLDPHAPNSGRENDVTEESSGTKGAPPAYEEVNSARPIAGNHVTVENHVIPQHILDKIAPGVLLQMYSSAGQLHAVRSMHSHHLNHDGFEDDKATSTLTVCNAMPHNHYPTSQDTLPNHLAPQGPLLAPAYHNLQRKYNSSILHDTRSTQPIHQRTKHRRRTSVMASIYQKPMYRKDIFLTGSICVLPEFSEQADVRGYIDLVTEVPPESSTDSSASSSTTGGGKRCTSRWRRKLREIGKELIFLFSHFSSFSVCKDIRFQAISLLYFFHMTISFTIYMFIGQLIRYTTADANARAELVVSIMGFSTFVGRFGPALAVSALGVSSLDIQLVLFSGALISATLIPFASGYVTTCILTSILAISLGCVTILVVPVLCEVLGIELLNSSYAAVCMIRGIGALAGPPLAGFLLDTTDVPYIPYVMVAVAVSISLVVNIALSWYVRRKPVDQAADLLTEKSNDDAQEKIEEV